MELRLGGAFRDIQHRGDLVMAVALDVMQHEDGASTVGQHANRRFQVESRIGDGDRSCRLLQLDRPVVVAYLMIIVLFFVVINLVVDILYSILDPRVRLRDQGA